MSAESATDGHPAHDRGQLVLLAAIALAVALVPLGLAYLQLGYHDDVEISSGPASVQQTERTLDRAVHDAVADVALEYRWNERSGAITTVHERLEPTVAALTMSGLDDGVTYHVTYNATRAESWEGDNCPGGPDRQFGACDADRGFVVQDRNGYTHVIGVAVDIEVTTPKSETHVVTVFEPGKRE